MLMALACCTVCKAISWQIIRHGRTTSAVLAKPDLGLIIDPRLFQTLDPSRNNKSRDLWPPATDNIIVANIIYCPQQAEVTSTRVAADGVKVKHSK
ncbi:hypothetical protein M405DRAFT_523700 [Rhizopogon salebrosus TDB-379]|nr:hypothetical protein M405DRAFT_523700 [Rhizopogon salebrosus TDB-379]